MGIQKSLLLASLQMLAKYSEFRWPTTSEPRQNLMGGVAGGGASITSNTNNNAPGITKPGCTAADESLVVYGHLSGLSRGWGGFGVLRESKKRLETASQAASIAGAPDLSRKFKAIAGKLPDIHDQAQASKVATELEPLLQEAWDLGRRCGMSISPELKSKVEHLVHQVKEGKMTKEQAVATLKADLTGGKVG